MDSLTNYIKNNYGRCKQGSACKCLKDGWRGRWCPEWEPVKENNWQEMIERLKKERKKEE